MGRPKIPGAATFIIGMKDFVGALFTYGVRHLIIFGAHGLVVYLPCSVSYGS
jgi:hypothetical protein